MRRGVAWVLMPVSVEIKDFEHLQIAVKALVGQRIKIVNHPNHEASPRQDL